MNDQASERIEHECFLTSRALIVVNLQYCNRENNE